MTLGHAGRSAGGRDGRSAGQ